MPGKIYLIQNDDTLQALSELPYLNEDVLQKLLANCRDLLYVGECLKAFFVGTKNNPQRGVVER